MDPCKPRVLIACNQDVRDVYLRPSDLDRLAQFADWKWLPAEGGRGFEPNDDPTAIRRLLDRAGEVEGTVVCHGAPRIDEAVLDHAPKLRVVGEPEGDRFAYRVDV